MGHCCSITRVASGLDVATSIPRERMGPPQHNNNIIITTHNIKNKKSHYPLRGQLPHRGSQPTASHISLPLPLFWADAGSQHTTLKSQGIARFLPSRRHYPCALRMHPANKAGCLGTLPDRRVRKDEGCLKAEHGVRVISTDTPKGDDRTTGGRLTLSSREC
jgi:hypothetical protein